MQVTYYLLGKSNKRGSFIITASLINIYQNILQILQKYNFGHQ